MRKNLMWCMALAFVLVACGRKKTVSPVDYTAELPVDSVAGSADSLFFSPEAQDEELPESADELFDDFIFEFAGRKKVQERRVRFPLLVVNRGDSAWVSREEWKYEPLFEHQDYYTVFFNTEEQMELEKRTDLNHVDVEQIDLERKRVKTCHFERLEGEWKLTEESFRDFTPAYPLDRFLEFYHTFVSDEDFQRASIMSPLRYVTTDPDDDFNVIEGTLDVDQWDAFRPQLPSGIITNIRYGQTYDRPGEMVLVKSGISNGLMDILFFKKMGGSWKLAAYEN